MYAYFIGRVAEINQELLVLEVGNIGYNIHIPSSLPALLPVDRSDVKIYTYTAVREDAIALYGFLTRSDLEMFRQLISVNGIGPKGALGLLSVLSADDIRMAVVSQDAKTIAKAPGIGARTAQRIILDLKDKVSIEEVLGHTTQATAAVTSGALNSSASEAVEALTALGYSSAEAIKAVTAVENGDSMSVEDLLKAALKHLF